MCWRAISFPQRKIRFQWRNKRDCVLANGCCVALFRLPQCYFSGLQAKADFVWTSPESAEIATE